jgi:hypothetical protein
MNGQASDMEKKSRPEVGLVQLSGQLSSSVLQPEVCIMYCPLIVEEYEILVE